MDIAAIITGILSVLAGFLPGLSPGRRAFAVVGGGGFAIYGWYVHEQTSGTWEFPIWLFLLPLYLIVSSARASQGHD